MIIIVMMVGTWRDNEATTDDERTNKQCERIADDDAAYIHIYVFIIIIIIYIGSMLKRMGVRWCLPTVSCRSTLVMDRRGLEILPYC